MTDLQSPRKMGLILELWKHPFDISNLASSTFHYLDMWTTYELLTSKPVFLKAWPRNNFMSITLECLFKLAILKPQPRSRDSESVRRDLGISILKQRLQAIFHTRIWEPLILVLLQVFSFPENHWGSLLQLGAYPAWSQVCFKGIFPSHASISFWLGNRWREWLYAEEN